MPPPLLKKMVNSVERRMDDAGRAKNKLMHSVERSKPNQYAM